MKKSSYILILLWISMGSYSQVSINTDGSAPVNSAMLEVKSSNKGFLPPRMTYAQLYAISNPADGLVVYCTDCGSNGLGTLSMSMGGIWYTLTANCQSPLPPVSAVHIPSSSRIVWNWNPVTAATGYKIHWSNNYASAMDVGNVTSNTENLLSCNTSYTRYIWAYNSCGGYSEPTMTTQTTSQLPPSPTSATAVPSTTSIVWNWNPVPGGTTWYKWNTVNNYATAVNMNSATTWTETGLVCNTSYTRYVWAYNNCGNSVPITLTQLTSVSPSATTAGTHVPSSNQVVWNWTTVLGASGYKWNTVNNYATATDMGNLTTKTETSLACNTLFTRYAWAYSACGSSVAATLVQTTSVNPAGPTAGTHTATPSQIIWDWNNVAGSTGYKWNTTNNYTTAIDMGAVSTKTETGLTCNTPYTRYVWAYNACGNSTAVPLTQSTAQSLIPAAPAEGTHTFTYNSVTWKWIAVPGAAGYKWNTTNNYTTATDMGAATSKLETGLVCISPYTRYVWAYSVCGNSTPTALTQTTTYCLWFCGDPITDSRDGKIYNTVMIGTQCWMAQNLNIGTKIDATIEQTNNSIREKYCFLNVNSNCNIYGGLYQWDEMMNYTTSSNANPSGRQGICMDGWHLPSESEWCEMTTFLDASVDCAVYDFTGSDVGSQLKESGTVHWVSPNTGATNSSGFTALPGGYRYSGTFGWLNNHGYFWTCTAVNSPTPSANFRVLYSDQVGIYKSSRNNTDGFSVRCVRD